MCEKAKMNKTPHTTGRLGYACLEEKLVTNTFEILAIVCSFFFSNSSDICLSGGCFVVLNCKKLSIIANIYWSAYG